MWAEVTSDVSIYRGARSAALSQWEANRRSSSLNSFHEAAEHYKSAGSVRTGLNGIDKALVDSASQLFSVYLNCLNEFGADPDSLRETILTLKCEWIDEQEKIGVSKWWILTIGKMWDDLSDDLSIPSVNTLLAGCWISSASNVFARMQVVRNSIYAISGAGFLLRGMIEPNANDFSEFDDA